MGTSSVRASAAANPLASLQTYGQSVWLDFIRASLITGGELQRIVDEDGLGGVTSNPAIFAKAAYEGVARAFVDASEARVNKGLPVDRVASVASFFVSRIDSAVDALLEEKMKTATGPDKARMLRLLGKVAIANAKVAYQSYKKTFSGPRWEPLAKKNAQTQRVL